MRGIGIIAALFVASAAWGVGPIGVGAYQIVGIPVGESTITEASGPGGTLTLDMTDGFPWKMGYANVDVATIVYFMPWLAAEGGFEVHTGYKNKAATIRGTITPPGAPFGWDEAEDNTTWKMMNLYVGPRFAYAVVPDFRILGRVGLLYSLSSDLEYDTKLHALTWTGASAKGTHLGTYFGSGFNWFFIPNNPHFAITGLYTYNMLFEGTYDYSGAPSTLEEEKWKPAPYVTAATGLEYYF